MFTFTKPAFVLCLLGLLVAAGILGGPSNGIEVRLMRQLAAIRAAQPGVTGMAGGITMLGGAYATLGASAVASLWLLYRRLPAQALLLILTVLSERLLVEGLKAWVGRPRPHFGVGWLPHSLAYPSGHSANSMTAFLAIALLLAPPARRGPWAMGALFLVLIVGLSRIYLGVHWPSDVIGGWALGLLAVTAALVAGRRSGALRFEPQHQIVGRHRPALGEEETS